MIRIRTRAVRRLSGASFTSFVLSKWISLVALVAGLQPAQAQDPQFSQFYAAPLYLNPAFAGSALAPRATVNYRNQWPSIDASYVTYAASFDYFFPKVNSGVGLLITQDRQGIGGLRSTDIAAQYAYQLQINENLAFRAGLQLAFVLRDINYSDLTFSDQINDFEGRFTDITGEVLNNGDRISYPDFSSGGLLYSDRFWVGFSAHHMNRPNQSFLDDLSRLPIKATIHAGLKIPIEPMGRGLASDVNAPERSISPAILYKLQGKFDQLDVGAYLTYEPLVLGVWYRGLPIKTYAEGLNNNEAVIGLIGFKNQGLSVGYSYDFTISSLGYQSGGAHEISVSYEFAQPTRNRLPRHAKKLPCPKF